MLGWDLDTHRHMIWHQMPCNNTTFLPTCQFVEDRPQGFANVAIEGLPSPFGHKHDVTLDACDFPVI
jgi:hypothetical protein